MSLIKSYNVETAVLYMYYDTNVNFKKEKGRYGIVI